MKIELLNVKIYNNSTNLAIYIKLEQKPKRSAFHQTCCFVQAETPKAFTGIDSRNIWRGIPTVPEVSGQQCPTWGSHLRGQGRSRLHFKTLWGSLGWGSAHQPPRGPPENKTGGSESTFQKIPVFCIRTCLPIPWALRRPPSPAPDPPSLPSKKGKPVWWAPFGTSAKTFLAKDEQLRQQAWPVSCSGVSETVPVEDRRAVKVAV